LLIACKILFGDILIVKLLWSRWWIISVKFLVTYYWCLIFQVCLCTTNLTLKGLRMTYMH